MPLENTDAEERITRETTIGWIEHWGESYDDVRPDDGAMRLANRIIEYNAATETIEALYSMMQFAPESTCMMIASDILAENAPLSLPALRERINTPDGMVNTDLLFSRLIDNGTTPDPARIDMAMGILGPLEANAPTDACYRIIGLKAMLSLAMGDGEKARELAEQAIGYDASDRFASSVLDRLPETDPAMEVTNVWENGGHLGR